MQEFNHRQSKIDFELTNNFNNVERTFVNLHNDRILTMHQIICLLEYKYLSQNAKYNKNDIGYELDENLYYENLLINKGDIITTLKEGIAQITQNNDNVQAAEVFYDLFNLVDFKVFNNNNDWLVLMDIVEKLSSNTRASIGEIIIFLTKYISSFHSYGSFDVSDDIVKLMTANQGDVNNIYDPFADEATLLAEIGNIINVKNYYGQHPNIENCALAKMTLLANDVNYKNIFIKCNDILEPIIWKVKFDLCVSIPPFGRRGKSNNFEDIRFKPYTPRKFELAYLLDMIYNLDEGGVIKIIVPDGVLLSGPDKKILKNLVENNLISTVIGLPEGVFDSTSTPTVLLILDKKFIDNGIYYLNLRNTQTKKHFKRKIISIEDIDKYIEILSNRTEQELLSKIATLEDITKNDYNLTINRYVDLEKLELIDIDKTLINIKKIKNELKQIDSELNIKIEGLFK